MSRLRHVNNESRIFMLIFVPLERAKTSSLGPSSCTNGAGKTSSLNLTRENDKILLERAEPLAVGARLGLLNLYRQNKI